VPGCRGSPRGGDDAWGRSAGVLGRAAPQGAAEDCGFEPRRGCPGAGATARVSRGCAARVSWWGAARVSLRWQVVIFTPGKRALEQRREAAVDRQPRPGQRPEHFQTAAWLGSHTTSQRTMQHGKFTPRDNWAPSPGDRGTAPGPKGRRVGAKQFGAAKAPLPDPVVAATQLLGHSSASAYRPRLRAQGRSLPARAVRRRGGSRPDRAVALGIRGRWLLRKCLAPSQFSRFAAHVRPEAAAASALRDVARNRKNMPDSAFLAIHLPLRLKVFAPL
jgi:hypothetical protein